MTVMDSARQSAEQESPALQESYALVAALSAMMAGGIHLAVAPEHAAVSSSIAGFFVVLGVGQLLLGASFRWRLSPAVLAGAIGVHLGVITLYVASRTVDLPFVPPHDPAHEIGHLPVEGGVGNGIPIYPGSRIEPVGTLDVACLLAELVLIAALTGMLPARWRHRTANVLLAMVVLAVVARASGHLG